MTIVVHATISTNPGTVDTMKSAIADLERATRAEPGCIDYVLASAINDPNVIRITEHWQSTEALKTHLATPHVAAFSAAMQKHPPKGMVVKMFEANEVPFPPR